MPETSNNPLIEAMKMRQKGSGDESQKLLEFILSHFNLVPKDEQKKEMVTTQESHSPS